MDPPPRLVLAREPDRGTRDADRRIFTTVRRRRPRGSALVLR